MCCLALEASSGPRQKKKRKKKPAPISPHQILSPLQGIALIRYRNPAGITGTVAWNTANAVDAKVEFDDNLAKDVKVEVSSTFKPDASDNPLGVKSNFFLKKSPFHIRGFVDMMKGPTATLDAVVGHEGFVAGGEAGYDVQKAALTKYSAAVGYLCPNYSAAVTASNNLNNITASFFQKVNSSIQAGSKATYDTKSAGVVGLEFVGRYQLDPLSFAKVGRLSANSSSGTLLIDRCTTGQGGSEGHGSDRVQHKSQLGLHLWHRRRFRHAETE